MHHSVRVQLLLRKRNVSFVNTNVYISIFLLCIPFRLTCVFQPFTCRDLNDCMNNPASANSCHAGVTNSLTFFHLLPYKMFLWVRKKNQSQLRIVHLKCFIKLKVLNMQMDVFKWGNWRPFRILGWRLGKKNKCVSSSCRE